MRIAPLLVEQLQRAGHPVRARPDGAGAGVRREAGGHVHARLPGAGRARPRAARPPRRRRRARGAGWSAAARRPVQAASARCGVRPDRHAARPLARETRDTGAAAAGRHAAGRRSTRTSPAAPRSRTTSTRSSRPTCGKGESIAVPIALLVLLAVFGFSAAVTMPFVFAACTITASLGVMYWVARAHAHADLRHEPDRARRPRHRDRLLAARRPPLPRGARARARRRTTRSSRRCARRAARSSSRASTVTIGLIALIAVPVPFMRMMGVAGFLIPVMSVLAALTLQPTLLSLYGPRGVTARFAAPVRAGFWARLAASIMRAPARCTSRSAAPSSSRRRRRRSGSSSRPGSSFGIPRTPPAIHGFDVLRGAVGTGSAVADRRRRHGRSGARRRACRDRAAVRGAASATPRSSACCRRAAATATPVLEAYGRHDYGTEAAQQFVRRLRSRLDPGRALPGAAPTC